MARHDDLKSKVNAILRDYPKSRDSDQWLTLKLWCVYFPSRIQRQIADVPSRPYIFLDDMMDLPREDNIKRVRAIIQNVEHRYLPTTWEVAKQREISRQDWETNLSTLKLINENKIPEFA